MKTRFIVRSLVSVFALTAASAFADAQSDLESKIANEVAGKYRAITAKANSLDAAWIARQTEKAAAVKDSSVGKDIVFLGDDAMAGWETTGAGAMSAFGSAKIFNLGYKGDCTEHVLWRVTDGGELSGYTAKAVVFTVGANNSAIYLRSEESPVATLYAIIHTLAKIRAAQPNATIIVNSILPRGANASDDVRRRIGVLNEDLRKWVETKGSGYVWCDLTDTFVDKAGGDALKTQYFENDKATLNASGYAAWAAVLDDYVAAAANGTAMPENLVCERRPLQGSAPDSTYGTSRTYPGLGYWDKLANFLYGNGVKHEADVVLLGDSITEKWAGPEMASSMYSLGDAVMNLGNSGDMTENLLWRLENGELEEYTSKIFNLLIGTNNTQEKDPLDSPEDIAAGVKKVIDLVLEKHPESKITLVPILPFGHVSRPDWGRMLDATNQAANAIIRTFADNQRVFLVDIDNSKFYNQDGTFNAQMYVGDEAALHYLHLSAKGYSEIVAPAVKEAIAAAGATDVTLPSVGSVSAAVSGTTATLTASDIAKGTLKSGEAASSATVFCKLDSAAETQCAGTTVELADLADGPHTCAVWVENEDGLVSAPKRVTFTINSKENEVGWSIAPMDNTGTGFRSSGTTVFANGYGYSAATVNGVEFGVSQWLPSEEKVSFSPAQTGSDGWGENNPIFTGGWYWNKTAGASMDLTATFKGLTTGHKYVAQMLVSYCRLDTATKVVSVAAGELAPVTVSNSGDCKYGVIVTRVFVASGATEDMKITIAGTGSMFLMKAIQLRDLGEGGEEDPTQEDDPVDPPAGSAWIPVPVPGSNPNSAPCTPNDGGQGVLGQHGIDKKNCQGKNFDLVMLGDSVTENWGSTGVEAANSKLKIDSSSDGVFCIGIGGNRTQHMIWRCQDGALGGDTPETGYTTKYFTLLAGVNNVYQKIIDEGGNPDNPEDIAEAIRTLINMIVAKHPESKILLMPILPYAYCYEKNGKYLSRHLNGIRVRETTEDVNDIIIKFVDNKRIFWVDVREKFVLADGMPNFELFGGPSGAYDPDQCLHPRTTGYDFFNTAVKAAMEKYQNVAAGTAQVTDPSIGLVTYSQSGFDAVPTIGLSGIYLGTDANAVPVTSYSVAYELDGGAKKTVLSDATATRNSFTIADVAPGAHMVKVTVTTADNKVMTRELTFTKCDGWVAEALSTDDGKIRKDGTLKCAYALDAYTLNDVPFAKVSGSIDNDNMTADFGIDGGGGAPTGVANGDYLSMLKKCWWANAGKHTVTLKQLTPGHNYLVQIIACRILDSMDGRVWIDEAFHESYRNAYTVKVRGDEYPCGGSLTGVFTADTTGTKTFSVVSDGNHAVNAIQVRDLGDSGVIPVDPVNPINPSIGSVSASVNGSTATISLKNIVKGTDDEAVAATSYSVAYTLNGAAEVTALSNQSAATTQFDISDLADGDYTCSVTITTDKNKTSAAKSANFTIKTSTPGGDDDPDGPVVPVKTGWTAVPLTASESSVSTTGTLVYAYCESFGNNNKTNLINGVPFCTFSDNGDFAAKQLDVAVSPAFASWKNDMGDGGAAGTYGNLLKSGFWSNGDCSLTYTLKNLKPGKNYLVQLFVHWDWAGSGLSATVGGKTIYAGGSGWTYGGSLIGVFNATGTEYSFTVDYTKYGLMNGIQVRELGTGPVTPVDPVDPEEPLPVYTLTIPAQDHLSVESVKTNNIAVTGSEGAYSIVSNTQVTITFAAETGYEITGGNPVVVTVESNMTLAQFPTVQEKQGSDDPVVPVADGWDATPMSETGDTIRKDGDLVYAYSRFGGTVNTVEFSALGGAVNLGDVYSKIKFRFTTDMYRDSNSDGADDYANILVHRFVNGTCDQVLTLKELESGSRYLVQLVLCFPESYAGGTQVTAPDGVTVAKANGTEWENGGSLVGVFTATNSTVTFDLKFKQFACMNAIQVRKLAAEDPVTPADPPVIGGEGVDVPMAVTSDKVSITISNAAAGHTYGYKKSVTLEGLATAEVIKLDSPAATAGVLTLDIPKNSAEPTCFYQIVVE